MPGRDRKRQVLFVQGAGAGTHDEWDNKLVESLRRELSPDHEIHYPQMPNEDSPRFAAWKPTLEKFAETLREDAVLVGHSVGGTMLMGWLAAQPPERSFGGIFLIAAPFVGDGGWDSNELRLPPDLGARLPKNVPIHLFHGLADETVPLSHLELYARAIPQAHVHRLPGRDHQLNDDLREVAAAISTRENG